MARRKSLYKAIYRELKRIDGKIFLEENNMNM